MLLKRKPINTFRGEYAQDVSKRVKSLLEFMGEICEPVLDIGCRNTLGQVIEKMTGLELINTHGDLNYPGWCSDNDNRLFKTIICSEVIEHLLNPALFLERLKLFCALDCNVYIFYPLRPRWFWTEGHFHEYDRKRFLYMLDYCGYEVIKYKWEFRKQEDWKYYLGGIRPLFFRWNIGKVRAQMYKLRLKA
jgi:hypothetical protein